MLEFEKTILKMLMLAFALTSTSTSLALDPWHFKENVDEITDEVSYFVVTQESSSLGKTRFLESIPMLGFKVTPPETPERGCKAGRIMLLLGVEGIKRDTPITYRLDKNPPVTEDWITTSNSESAIPPDNQAFLKKLLSSKELIIRYSNFLGHTRTIKFRVANLSQTFREIKSEYFAKHPPKPKPPSETPEARQAHEVKMAKQEVPTLTKSNAHETELIAKATTSMKDIRHALEYARTRTGPMPSMKSETTLNKPLAALEKAIAKKKQAADNLETIERRFNNLNPGNLSRPSPEKLARARTTLKNAERELSKATAEIHNATRKILQETDWPTPELSAKAESLAARIPYRNTTY